MCQIDPLRPLSPRRKHFLYYCIFKTLRHSLPSAVTPTTVVQLYLLLTIWYNCTRSKNFKISHVKNMVQLYLLLLAV